MLFVCSSGASHRISLLPKHWSFLCRITSENFKLVVFHQFSSSINFFFNSGFIPFGKFLSIWWKSKKNFFPNLSNFPTNFPKKLKIRIYYWTFHTIWHQKFLDISNTLPRKISWNFGSNASPEKTLPKRKDLKKNYPTRRDSLINVSHDSFCDQERGKSKIHKNFQIIMNN